jgi:hypothetical protein
MEILVSVERYHYIRPYLALSSDFVTSTSLPRIQDDWLYRRPPFHDWQHPLDRTPLFCYRRSVLLRNCVAAADLSCQQVCHELLAMPLDVGNDSLPLHHMTLFDRYRTLQ